MLRDIVDNDVVESVSEQSLSVERAEQTFSTERVVEVQVTPLVAEKILPIDSDEDDFVSATPITNQIVSPCIT